MKINTNKWNKIRYTVFTPVYDWIGKIFSRYRKLSIQQLDIKSGDNVLLIGAGTGLDLEYIPKEAVITATDITPSMINKTNKRLNQLGLNGNALVMDGQQLEFEDNSFDKVILHLILAVIPDPVACIKEVERVLKPGGSVVVYDKFLSENAKLTLVRKGFNLITNLLFSDITRRFGDIISQTNLKLVDTIDGGFKGFFKIHLLKK